MKSTTFEALVSNPQIHRMPPLAGQRVRMAELLVEVSGHTVLRIVRRVYFVLTFDQDGRVDTERFQRQQWALAGIAIDGVFAQARDSADVLDATDRFVAQGGRWRPSPAVAQRIDEMCFA
ncbi:hypothetical protein [Roseateles sp.]|uniref:hypothetical protein n=1 Tax=Roseateles sp. TaxID=1971397 RepID=UPI0032643123